MQHFLGSILSQVLVYFQQIGNGVRVFQSIATAVHVSSRSRCHRSCMA